MLDRIAYRFRQFWFGITSKLNEDDREFIRRRLDIKEKALFDTLPDYEKKHAVEVARRMLNAHHKDPHLDQKVLAKAGLLNDVAKAAVKLSIFAKAAMAAIKRISPSLYDRLSSKGMADGSPRLYRKFFVYKHHGEIGAEMLRRIGASDEVLTCVEAHDAMKFMDDRYLKILNDADNTI